LSWWSGELSWRSGGLSPRSGRLSQVTFHEIRGDEVALQQVFLRDFSRLPRYSLLCHCSVLICCRKLICAIAPTRQHIITSSVLMSELHLSLGWLRSKESF
jgi:hypothetical protein